MKKNEFNSTSSLAALTEDSQQSKNIFITDYWPNEPFVIHGLTESIAELTEIPFLKSLSHLLNFWSDQISVHLPDASDESSAIQTNSENAAKLFNNKMALLFNHVHKKSPILNQWLLNLKKDLGLPESTISRCMVYATPDKKGTAAHFDQNINFVLQLHGTKTWWIAENEHVENPTERFTIGQPMGSELASYVEIDMPKVMPLNKKEIILKPGSMLFVPRGYWHMTQASGDALALNFTFSQPTWADLLTAALHSRLNLSPDWRDLADGVNSVDADRKQLAVSKFDLLLQDLILDLPNWQAADILKSTEG